MISQTRKNSAAFTAQLQQLFRVMVNGGWFGVDEIAHFMAESLILLGFGFFALVALVVMLRINARITVVVFVPLLIVIVVVNLAMKRIEAIRQVPS